jgi:hypothetical protein
LETRKGKKMSTTPRILVCLGLLALLVCAWKLPMPRNLAADEPAPKNSGENKESAGNEKPPANKFGDPPGAKRLDPKAAVWIDVEKKLVIADGYVCLREGQLEMFACLKGTKEHEAVVAVDGKAYYIHAGLLAIGAKAGTPVQFDPMYKPASGTEVEVLVLWMDKDGKKHQAKAQEWIRQAETKKIMSYPWVFAGSGFWFDETTGREHYQAEGGDLICVSNFPSATLDIPVESSQGNMELLFEVNTAAVPPLKTPIRLVLKPKFKEGEEEAKPAGEEKPGDEPKPESEPKPTGEAQE